jgi:hypothetical protein
MASSKFFQVVSDVKSVAINVLLKRLKYTYPPNCRKAALCLSFRLSNVFQPVC